MILSWNKKMLLSLVDFQLGRKHWKNSRNMRLQTVILKQQICQLFETNIKTFKKMLYVTLSQGKINSHQILLKMLVSVHFLSR